MNVCDECGEAEYYDLGDRVRLVQNHMLTGQVLDEQGWGAKYQVRIGTTVTALWFDACELEPDPDHFDPAKAETPPTAPAEEGTVIFHDFRAAKAAGGAH